MEQVVLPKMEQAVSPIQVKVCGLTQRRDALEVEEAGADFMGVVSVPESPRFRTPEEAGALAAGLKTPLAIVIADRNLRECVEAGRVSGAHVIQLHGQEGPELVKHLGEEGPWEVWKALRVRGPRDLAEGLASYGEAATGLLLDAWHPRKKGGTGAPFSWREVSALRDTVPADLVLGIAGGLSPENVAEAIRWLRPDLVDVSSGVEESPGKKNHVRIREFVQQVRGAGRGVSQ